MPPPQPSSPASSSHPDQKSSRVSDLPPYGLHGLGSTASLVGMLKAAALNPYETHDEGLADDPDPWQPSPILSPNLNTQSPALLADNESDDGSNTEEEYLLTPTRPPHPQSLIQGASALDYPTKQHLDGLARQLIGHQTRCAELAIKNRHPSSLGVLPGPASSQTSFARTITRDPSPPATLSKSSEAQIASLAQLGQEVEETSNTTTEPDLTPEDRLRLLEEQFGIWTGLDARGQPESETWIDQIPGVLYRSVIVRGVIALTNRRLCYLAYLPIMDNGKLIRSGTATYKSGTRFFKRQRRWIELRTDSVTDYRSSSKLFRPLSSLHLSDIKRILPISPAEPRTLSFRLVDDQLIHLEFDTAESTALWHRDFVGALFSFKTNYSNQIKLSLPLRRIRKLQRENFDNIAKMMTFDLDFGTLMPYCHDGMEALYQGVVEEDSSKVHHHRLQLAYLLFNDPFDETVIDAIVRAKLELTRAQESSAQSSRAHYTPSPVFEVLEADEPSPEAEESEEKEQSNESRGMTNLGALARGFVKAFGLKADQKLYICPCSLVRTLPAFGNMALSDDYFCFWRRVMMIGQDLKLRIPLFDIGLVSEASAFGFTRFGLAFEIAGAADIRLDFSSAAARDESMKALRCAVDLARARANRRQSSLPIQSANPLGQMPIQAPQISLSTDQIKTLPAIISNVQLNQTVRPLRVVCMTIGSRGDVQPYISLAKQLQKDGHTVTIASHPEYRSWVESFGILYKDVGGDPGALMKLSVEHSFFSAGFFKESLGHFRKWLDDLFNEAWLACKESDAELLIESPSTFSGIHIAEALRIPYFRAFTMTWTSTSTYPQAFAATMDLGPHYNLVSYMLFDNLIWRAMAGQVNRWRKHTLGIPPTSLEKMQPYKVPFLYNFSSAVVPKPLDWRDHISVTGYWFLDESHGDYKAPEDLTTFITKARSDGVPLIYVGFGSVTVPDAAAVTKAIYGAVVAAGVRAVVAKGWSERVSLETAEAVEVPPEVFVLQSVPHDWLFPQLDAVCHHGGAGTTGISLRFGLPTLIHPFFGDQMFWADRVTRLGAGMRVESLSMSCLASAFGKATKDRVMKEKACQVGERIRAEDGPRTAVEFIYRHLDFALERTEHRIKRTAIKRPRLSLAPGDNNLNTVEDVLVRKKGESDLLSPVEEPAQDLLTLEHTHEVVVEGTSPTATKKKSTSAYHHLNRKLVGHTSSLGKLKELIMSIRFLVRISSSTVRNKASSTDNFEER